MSCIALLVLLVSCFQVGTYGLNFEWITPSQQTVTLVENSKAHFIWFFKADVPYSLAVINKGPFPYYDVLQMNRTRHVILTGKYYDNVARGSLCDGHVDGEDGVYCVAMEMTYRNATESWPTDAGSGYRLTLTIDGEYHQSFVTVVSSDTSCQPEIPMIDVYYKPWIVTTFTELSGTDPPALVLLYVDGRLVEGCEVTNDQPQCIAHVPGKTGFVKVIRCGEILHQTFGSTTPRITSGHTSPMSSDPLTTSAPCSSNTYIYMYVIAVAVAGLILVSLVVIAICYRKRQENDKDNLITVTM